MPLLQNARFYTSAHHYRELPKPNGMEIAFAGRSNAGKSSALNTLANHNRLAFVSKQPGRTQLINLFSLDESRYLVDLPGYGYAKVPEETRKHWQKVLSRYLTERESLFGLVLVMDSRHPLTKLDCQMLDWFAPTGKPIHVLLTKSDKLSKYHANKTLEEVNETIETNWGEYITVQLFSSLKKQGIEEAEAVLGDWLYGEDEEDLIEE